MEKELYDSITNKSEAGSEEEKKSAGESKSWLIFNCFSDSYAIESSCVREILRNNVVFPVPFVPSYVKGVLNFYGKPFAVIDFAQFQDEKPQDSKLFLVLNNENDVALQITDIQEFHTSNENLIQKISSANESSYFSGAINFDNGIKPVVAPVLNINGILAKIRTDFEIN